MESPARVDDDRLRAVVWAALATVGDPEQGRPVTGQGLVGLVDVHDGDVTVVLRAPTYVGAPNLICLMVADAHDAVAAVPGVQRTVITLRGHVAAAEITAGVTEWNTSAGDADDHLQEVRENFRRTAYLASLERVCAIMLGRDWDTDELYRAQIFDLPTGPERTSLLHRRDELGMSCLPRAYLLMDENGLRIPQPQIRFRLRSVTTARGLAVVPGTEAARLDDVS